MNALSIFKPEDSLGKPQELLAVSVVSNPDISTPLFATVPQTTNPVAHEFGPRLLIGLTGVLIASLAAGLNGNVTDIAMNDIRGGFFIGRDESSWFTAFYQASQSAADGICAVVRRNIFIASVLPVLPLQITGFLPQ